MIRAFIPSYKCVDLSGSRSYYVYTIQVQNGARIVHLDKRYSDFLQLHKELRKNYLTPEFPPKRVRNATVKVLESRRLALESYIQGMLGVSPIPKELTSFLNINPHQQHTRLGISTPIDDQSAMDYNGVLESYEERCTLVVSPAAAFVEDPFIDESDSSSNLSDCITRGVLDALYQTDL